MKSVCIINTVKNVNDQNNTRNVFFTENNASIKEVEILMSFREIIFYAETSKKTAGKAFFFLVVNEVVRRTATVLQYKRH